MPNKKYLELQALFYSAVYPDETDYKMRVKALKKLYGCQVWGTYQKQVIPFPFMKESHLINAFHHKRKQAEDLVKIYESPSPFSALVDRFDGGYHSMCHLIDEMERRKLKNIPLIPMSIKMLYEQFNANAYDYFEGMSEWDWK